MTMALQKLLRGGAKPLLVGLATGVLAGVFFQSGRGNLGALYGLLLVFAALFVYWSREVWKRREKMLRDQLAEARTAQAQALRSQESFLTNISHELRTPMTGILGATELLFDIQLPRDARSHVRTIESSAERLLRLLEDVLTISELERSDIALEAENFSLRSLLEDLQAEYLPKARVRGLRLELHLAEPIPDSLHGDAVSLREALGHLVDNAVKFTAEGVVEVHAALEEEALPKVLVRFTVKDTGPGIADEDRALIFGHFTQADSSRSRRSGGAGLGLALSQKLVGLMGGRIALRSRVGEGSSFSFTVLLSTAVPELSTGRFTQVPRGRRVLLVEDDPTSRTIALAHLEHFRCEVETGTNGHEALAALDQGNFDLVLMDCQMPELDGYETCRILRQRPGGAMVPVVAVTAHALKGEREKCLSAGMNDYLAKPYRRRDLGAILDRWLKPLPPEERPPDDSVAEDFEIPGALNPGKIAELRRVGVLATSTRVFLDDSAALFEELQAALAAEDASKVKQLAHRWKGSASVMGADLLAGLCRDLEGLAADGNLADCRDVWETVEPEFEEVRAELAAILVDES